MSDIDPGYWRRLTAQSDYTIWLGQAATTQYGGIYTVCTGAYWTRRLRGDTIRLRP